MSPEGILALTIALLLAYYIGRRSGTTRVVYRSPNSDKVVAAFHSAYADGTRDLYSALPNDLLLQEYGGALDALVRADGDAEKTARAIPPVFMMQMEMATRLTKIEDGKRRLK